MRIVQCAARYAIYQFFVMKVYYSNLSLFSSPLSVALYLCLSLSLHLSLLALVSISMFPWLSLFLSLSLSLSVIPIFPILCLRRWNSVRPPERIRPSSLISPLSEDEQSTFHGLGVLFEYTLLHHSCSLPVFLNTEFYTTNLSPTKPGSGPSAGAMK